MKNNVSQVFAGGEGSVRGPNASSGFRAERGQQIPKFRKGNGQKNNRKRDRAKFNNELKERREFQALMKRGVRTYERSGSDFNWGEG